MAKIKKEVVAIHPAQVAQGFAEFKASLLANANGIESRMEAATIAAGKLDEQIQARREMLAEMDIVYSHAQSLEEIEARKAAAEADARQHQAALKQERDREAADFRYNLERSRKIEREEYDDNLKARRASDTGDLDEREQALDDRESDLLARLSDVALKAMEADAKMAEANGLVPTAVAAAVAAARAAAEAEARDEIQGHLKRIDLLEADAGNHLMRLADARAEVERLQAANAKLQADLTNIATEAVSSATHKAANATLSGAIGATAGQGGKR